MSKIDLPDWSLAAINEVAKTNSWDALISDIEESLLKSNKLEKRFSEYTEYEQAVLVEQEMKHLQLVESRHLYEFNRALNVAVDERLMEFIAEIVPTKTVSSVQQLLNICSKSVIQALESSPPGLESTAKLFLNRIIPDELRAHLWSSALKISRHTVDTSSCPRISPSLDVLLARRCHLLLDCHYPQIASRAAAALLKTTISDFMRYNGCPLPHDDDSSCHIGEYHEYYDNDAQNVFDRLFFLVMPLSSVFPGTASPPGDAEAQGLPTPPHAASCKPHELLEKALQTLVDARHLGLLLNSTEENDASFLISNPVRPITADPIADEDAPLQPHSEILRTYSPLLPVTKALVLKKNPSLHEHILDLVSTDQATASIVAAKQHDRESIGSPRRVKKNVVNDRVVSFFYDVFINECLLRGLSGLLPLETTQFVWDQCFVMGFSKMLPVIAASLLLGCAKEFMALTHTGAAVDSFSSYCRHSSVETIQRLLTNHAATELHDMFNVEGMYVLDANEENDKLLRAVYMKMRPSVSECSVLKESTGSKDSGDEETSHEEISSSSPRSDPRKDSKEKAEENTLQDKNDDFGSHSNPSSSEVVPAVGSETSASVHQGMAESQSENTKSVVSDHIFKHPDDPNNTSKEEPAENMKKDDD